MLLLTTLLQEHYFEALAFGKIPVEEESVPGKYHLFFSVRG